MEVVQDGGDMVMGTGSSEESGSRVLNVLKFIESFGGGAVENAITVVKAGGDEGMNEGFGG